MFTIIAGVLGIAGTLIAYFLNPKQAIYRELDAIYHQLEGLYVKRDQALENNDTNTLTLVTASIVQLSARKNTLFQRLK